MASARLANSTVSHSQAEITQAKTLGLWTEDRVVSTAPTSTTNMTGFPAIFLGWSFLTAPGSEARSCRGSSSPPEARPGGLPRGAAGGPAAAGAVTGALPRAAPGTALGSR